MTPTSASLPDRTTVLRIVSILALVVIVAPFVVHAVPEVIGANHSYVVLSNSMADQPRPVIHSGDVVVVREVDPGTIEEGDIITFLRDPNRNKPTTHRVVGVRTEHSDQPIFETKGDANEDLDPQPIPADRMIGEVWFVIPYIGYVIQFANSWTGFLMLVLAPIGLLIVSEAWALAKGTVASSESTDPDHGDTETTEDDIPGRADLEDEANPEEGSGSKTYTLAPSELRLALPVLALFAVYSSWIVYVTRTGWSVAVAVGAIASAILAAGVYHTGTKADQGSASSPEPSTATEGSIPGMHYFAGAVLMLASVIGTALGIGSFYWVWGGGFEVSSPARQAAGSLERAGLAEGIPLVMTLGRGLDRASVMALGAAGVLLLASSAIAFAGGWSIFTGRRWFERLFASVRRRMPLATVEMVRTSPGSGQLTQETEEGRNDD